MVPNGDPEIPARSSTGTRGVRWIGVRLSLIAAGLALGLLISELTLRILLPFLPGEVKDQINFVAPGLRKQSLALKQLHEPDPDFGWVMRPSMRRSFRLRHEIPLTTVTTNDLGFRGPRAEGAPVIIVGDSFAFGYGVDDENTSASELSRLLGLQVATLGVTGYGPSQYNKVLRKYGLPAHPRVVLYFLTLGNDFGPGSVLDDERVEPARTPSILNRVNTFLSGCSVMYQLAKRSINTGVYRHGRHVRSGDLDLYFHFDDSFYDLERQDVRRSFEIVDENLRRAWAESGLAAVEMVLVVVPTKESVYRHVAERYAPAAGFFDAEDELRRRIASLSRARGWRHLDLTPAFQRRAVRGEQLYFVYDGHWNAEGHRAAAAEIYRYLIREQLVKAGVPPAARPG